MGMSKYIPSIGGIFSAIFTISIAKGVLLWLSSLAIYPDYWIAKILGIAETGITNYPEIAYILLGISGLLGLAIYPVVKNLLIAKATHRKNPEQPQSNNETIGLANKISKIRDLIDRVDNFDQVKESSWWGFIEANLTEWERKHITPPAMSDSCEVDPSQLSGDARKKQIVSEMLARIENSKLSVSLNAVESFDITLNT